MSEIAWSDTFKVVERMEREQNKDYTELKVMLAEAVLREARLRRKEQGNE